MKSLSLHVKSASRIKTKEIGGNVLNKSESKYFNTAVKMDKALLSLLESKSFEYITVSEICKAADVNRSTFYLHYENTVDLLNETIRYLLDNFMTYFDVDTKNITSKFSECSLIELCFITDKYLYPYLSYIKDNKQIFSTALSHANSFGFDDIFTRLYENIFNPILDRFHYPIDDRKYVMIFYLNGINAVINEWLKDGCQKNVQEVSKIIHECIFGLENINLE